MAFEQTADGKSVNYHGIDIEPKWKKIKAKRQFVSNKRHFEPREEGKNAGSKLYKSSANRFLSSITKEHRDKYNAHASCSAAQLIVEID